MTPTRRCRKAPWRPGRQTPVSVTVLQPMRASPSTSMRKRSRIGIALMGHRGAAALFAAEGFFSLADFGALQMANFERDFLECSGDEREGAEILRMAVALNHL